MSKNNKINKGLREVLKDIKGVKGISIDIAEMENQYEFPESGYSEEDDDEEAYQTNSYTEEISFIEFAIINAYFYDAYRGKHKEVLVSGYGTTDNIGRIDFGGTFEITGSYWFTSKFENDDNEYFIQSKMFIDSRGELINQLHCTSKKEINHSKFIDMVKNIKKISFNNSEYKGKCIKVKLREGRFRGIEVIDITTSSNDLILNDIQLKFIKHSPFNQ